MNGDVPVRKLIAKLVPAMCAVLAAPRPLHLHATAAASDGLPAHVRAASAIRRQGSRLVVVGSGEGGGNAVIDLPLAAFCGWLAGEQAAPAVTGSLIVDCGAIHGVPFGFTDAAAMPDGRLAFLACAEDSPDVRRDGPVLGCRFGWLDDDGVRVTDIVDEGARPTTLKLEGIEPRAAEPAPGDNQRFDVVADMDRPGEAAVMAELRVRG